MSSDIAEKGKVLERDLSQLLHSPPLMEEDCPLETRINHNWSVSSNPSDMTIPGLIEDFTHLEARDFEYSPPVQDGKQHAYARYDVAKAPRVKEYLDAINKLVIKGLPDGTNQNDVKSLIVRTGSSILPDILQILDTEGRRRVVSPFDERFLIQILSDSPYFEAGKAIAAVKPIHALEYETLTFFPPTSEGVSGPSAEVISTESNAPHLWNIDRSLQDGGICCFYAEPIGNNPSMDVPNLRKTIETIRAAKKMDPNSRKVFLIVDASIMGGDFDVKKLFNAEDFRDINLIVTESVNKYLSYGTNKANLGFTYGLGPDSGWFFESLLGAVQMKGQPDYRSVLSVPLPDEQIIEERKNRFQHNTKLVADNIQQEFAGHLEVVHPSLRSHTQHQRAEKEYEFQGSIFFIKVPNEAAYDTIEKRLSSSKLIGLGTSYGFNKTRAEVIRRKTDSGEKKPLALRVSVGTENIRELMLVYEELRQILSESTS